MNNVNYHLPLIVRRRIQERRKKQFDEVSRTLYTGSAHQDSSDEYRDSFHPSCTEPASTDELAEFFINDLDMTSVQTSELSDDVYRLQKACVERALSSMEYIFCPNEDEEHGADYGNHGRKPLSTISRQGMNSVYEKY